MSKINGFVKKTVKYVEHYSNRRWYGPLIGFLAAVDAYVFVISVEAFLLPVVMVRPRKWISASAWGTLGSALGATSFAWLTSRYGEPIVRHLLPNALNSKAWLDASQYLVAHGFVGLGFVSLGPLPQHIAVAVAGLAHMKISEVFLAVLIGRGIKYFFLSWAVVHSPKLLRKLNLIKEV